VTTHWFDDLTKNFAGAFTGRSLAQPPPISAGSTPDVCGRRRTGNLVIREVSLSQDGVTVRRRLAYDVATHSGQSSVTITKGQTPILQLDVAATKEGSVTATVSYGPDVQGAKSLTLTSKNGTSFQGLLDGRVFSLSKSSRPPIIEFLDGQPAPQISADPKLVAVINGLCAEVNKSLATCGTAVAVLDSLSADVNSFTFGVATAKSFPSLRPQFSRNVIPAPGSDWYEPAGEDHISCLQCDDNCNKTLADATSNFFCWLSIACVVEADAQWAVCETFCRLPGGGCLPNPCGSFTTCGIGDKCFSYKGGSLCCQAPAVVCQDVCCGVLINNCLPDGTCGCTADQDPCGNDCCDRKTQYCAAVGVCCPNGQILSNGVCCSPISVCGKVCCDELASCADPTHGICCSFGFAPCSGQCCAIGVQCINGKCCPHDSICGGVCCPKGQTCLDPKTHKCSPCPSGTVPCLPEGGTGLCCAPNVDCCIGTCCKPGEVCRFTGAINGQPTYHCGPQEIPT
jgi:hypothetical protein